MRLCYGAIVSILLAIFNQGHAELNKNIAGPFDLILKHVEPCGDLGTRELELIVKVRKTSRTATALDGSLITKLPVDDRISMMINVGQFTNNGIKKNFFKREFDRFCSTLGTFLPKLKKQLMKKIGIEDCPIPPGNYSVRNLNFTETLQQIPIFFYNKYRTEMSFKRGKKVLGCNLMFIEIVPKRGHS